MMRCEVALDYCGVEELGRPVVLAGPTGFDIEAALEAGVISPASPSADAQYGLPFSS